MAEQKQAADFDRESLEATTAKPSEQLKPPNDSLLHQENAMQDQLVDGQPSEAAASTDSLMLPVNCTVVTIDTANYPSGSQLVLSDSTALNCVMSLTPEEQAKGLSNTATNLNLASSQVCPKLNNDNHNNIDNHHDQLQASNQDHSVASDAAHRLASPGSQACTHAASNPLRASPSQQFANSQAQETTKSSEPSQAHYNQHHHHHYQQQHQSTRPAPSSASNPDTRTHVVGELYDTERSYVESLQILVEKYMKPLKAVESNKALIDTNLVDEIFHTLPEILQHHETFLCALQERLSSDWDSSQIIGNVFNETFTNQKILDTYTAFINNWKNAKQAIKVATQSKPAFERFLESMAREHRNKLTLDALLIMPVQRIPRYELLIKELIKHTPEDHPDYGPLIEAQDRIHNLALKIDQAEKEMMHQEQLKDLESLIEGHIELQDSNRDFLRYDLVTILGSSSLTIAKKERVFFLFCDLLVMTSVKKKVSRKSNLQTAFANSFNDLSLLEGNKFKLLMRVSIDQVEISIDNETQSDSHKYNQLVQSRTQNQPVCKPYDNQLAMARRREIEADLNILNHLASLSLELRLVDVGKLYDDINDYSEYLNQKLDILDQNESQTFKLSQTEQLRDIPSCLSNSNSAPYLPQQVSSSPSNSSGYKPPLAQPPSSLIVSNQTNVQQDSSTNLKLIIYNSSENNTSITPAKDLTSAVLINPNEHPSGQTFDQAQQSSGSAQKADNLSFQSADFETLEVSFGSAERRHAFMQAFVEAKQSRYLVLQQQHFQHQQEQMKRVYTSSVTLRLSHPENPSDDWKANRLSAQDPSSMGRLSGKGSPNFIDDAIASQAANYSVKLNHTPHMVHQASAPHSLSSVGDFSNLNQNGMHRNSSSINLIMNGNTTNNNQYPSQHNHFSHHYHHHQLVHQPASHPGPTICCDDDTLNVSGISRNSQLQRPASNQFCPSLTDPNESNNGTVQNSHCLERHDSAGQDITSGANGMSPLTIDLDRLSLGSQTPNENFRKMGQSLLLKAGPKFVMTLPMNFLSTHHPALQFSCSVSRDNNCLLQTMSKDAVKNETQAISTNNDEFWLCLSNGYVSHVASISLRRDCEMKYCSKSGKKYSTLAPFVRSAGDICKSQIVCAAQIKCSRRQAGFRVKKCSQGSDASSVNRGDFNSNRSSFDGEKTSNIDEVEILKPQVEVTIKSASPPVNIKGRPESDTVLDENSKVRLSESAPSNGSDSRELCRTSAIGGSSMSAGQLVPLLSAETQKAQDNDNALIRNTDVPSKSKLLHGSVCQRQHFHNTLSRQIQSRGAMSNLNTCRRQLIACGNRNQSLVPLNSPIGNQRLHLRHNLQPHNHNRQPMQHAAQLQSHNHQHHYGHHTHHHHHHHHHQHSHLHHHAAPSNQQYTTRHNTVPITQLRRALERQNCVPDASCSASRMANLVRPATQLQIDQKSGGSSLAKLGLKPSASKDNLDKRTRSATPPAAGEGKVGRSARSLRHQASLKTNSILARLVGGASKKTSYLTRKPSSKRQKSDIEDGDTDNEVTNNSNTIDKNTNSRYQQDDNSSIDSNILSFVAPTKQHLDASFPDVNNVMVSPLSSVSSLNTTSSSITINSMCASLTNRSNCDILAHSYSTSCCAGSSLLHNNSTFGLPCAGNTTPIDQAAGGLRSRSATVPSRAAFNQQGGYDNSHPTTCGGRSKSKVLEDTVYGGLSDSFKVSEILGDEENLEQDQYDSYEKDRKTSINYSKNTLWLGCEGGSLIVISCLTDIHCPKKCNYCESNSKNLTCNNIHTEVKLGASICDVCVYKDKLVFIALSNGQLAIFSRRNSTSEDGNENLSDIENDYNWDLTKPKMVSITNNELNTSSKLCYIEENYIWYAYGRNIFVLNAETLSLETTIKPPINDMSLKISLQSISIDNMEPMGESRGVWISFKNCHLIQLYCAKKHIILLEINLSNTVDRILSFGSEIIRQHKNACLKATSLLNWSNIEDAKETLFIGTSAGIVLYLDISHERLNLKLQKNDGSSVSNDWRPQISSLSHGHSGHVKLLNLVELSEDQSKGWIDRLEEVDSNNNSNCLNEQDHPQLMNQNEVYLISGGIGLDVYGSLKEHQMQHNHDNEDSLNHLIVWQLK